MDPSEPVLVASAAALAAWGVAVAVAAFRNAPAEPQAAAATTELSEEPPAVVNLLTDGFRVTSEAVPATLLDLAARRLVDIELVAANQHVIRLRPLARADALAEHEVQVLDHVRRIAVDGVVPADALTTGPRDASRRWWHRFREAVIADAQSRGLCRNRWAGGTVLRLWALALVPAFLYGVAVRFDLDNVNPFSWSGLLLAMLVGAGGLLVAITASRAQRDTPAGLETAGRWLGVRGALAENEALRDVPPSAVAIWGRHLAYAAAMGLAPAAVTALPLGAEDDHVAWSAAGGRWRRVRIAYPRFRPGWGLDPSLAIVLGLAWALPALVILLALAPFRYPDAVPPYEAIAVWLGRAQLVFAVALASVVFGGVAVAVQGVADLRARRSVTGVAVRCRSRKVVKLNPWRKHEKRRYYVAVDDARSDRIDAWSVRASLYHQLEQRDTVDAELTPRLGYVTRMARAREGAPRERA